MRLILFSDRADRQEEYKRIIEEKFYDEGIKTNVVNAQTPYKERQRIFDEFSNSDFSVLINYAIINEGIDLPGCTGVIIGRNMDDVILIQSIGRALRLFTDDRENYGPNSNDPNKEKYKKNYGLVYFLIDHSKAQSESYYEILKDYVRKIRKLTGDKGWYITTNSGIGFPKKDDDNKISDSQPSNTGSDPVYDEQLKNLIDEEIDEDLEAIQKRQANNDQLSEMDEMLKNNDAVEVLNAFIGGNDE